MATLHLKFLVHHKTYSTAEAFAMNVFIDQEQTLDRGSMRLGAALILTARDDSQIASRHH